MRIPPEEFIAGECALDLYDAERLPSEDGLVEYRLAVLEKNLDAAINCLADLTSAVESLVRAQRASSVQDAKLENEVRRMSVLTTPLGSITATGSVGIGES